MGKSDGYLRPFYKKNISPKGTTALLGFTNNKWFKGDLYDRALGNWDINSFDVLPKKYDTIISLRCPYFAKNPLKFIGSCAMSLNPGGKVFLDWGLGDHWRFKEYKVGWKSEKEHEYAYGKDNYLWSCLWDQSFEENKEVQSFKKRIDRLGYKGSLTSHVLKEVPSILRLQDLANLFKVKLSFLALWETMPQLYIFAHGEKKCKQ